MSRIIGLRAVLATIVATVPVLAMATRANAADCLKDHREIVLAKDDNGQQTVIRMREYLCRPATRQDQFVRVQFHRLSDAAAHSLLEGKVNGPLGSVFGRHALADNQVAKNYRALLTKFGSSTYEGLVASLGIDTPIGGIGTAEKLAVSQQYTEPQQSPITLPSTSDMPMINDLIHIRDQTTWPDGYNFFYSGYSDDINAIGATNIWRFATTADLVQYNANVSKMTRLVGKEQASYLRSHFVEMIRHVLKKQSLPNDFLIISGNSNECGENFSFEIGGREFLLDVVAIENATGENITLDALLGQEILDTSIRKIDRNETVDQLPREVIGQRGIIRPGEKFVIPIRIFARAAANDWFWLYGEKNRISAESGQIYQKIRRSGRSSFSSKTGLSNISTYQRVLRKLATSFLPPSVPSAANYGVGPEIKVAGLSVDGKHLLLEGASANFLNLTVTSGAGSCPILFFSQEGTDDWRRYGKVIHQARGRGRDATQRIRFPGLVRQYRLSEEELEVSHIDSIQVTLELRSGKTRALKSFDTRLRSIDYRYRRIFAGDKLDVHFSLPKGVSSVDVTSTVVEITGYYERYSSIIAGAK